MRKRFEQQLRLGVTPIEQIKVGNGRDAQVAVLQALQWIFCTPEVNQEVFELLESRLTPKQKSLGRKGMDLWTILVFATMRLTRNQSYDDLRYSANHDTLMREMVGIGVTEQETQFSLTSLKENLSLLDDELLAKVNAIVIKHSDHVAKKKHGKLRLKTDSYVLENNVHFPTDLNLAHDAARKSIELSYQFANSSNLPGWRKARSWKSAVKKLYLYVVRVQHGGGKNKEKRLQKAVGNYLEKLTEVERKTTSALTDFKAWVCSPLELVALEQIRYFLNHLTKHIDLIKRRLINKETIPQDEKVFSLFEPHTEWISKGKLHKKVELGHRVLITTDQNHLIVDYKVMVNSTDSEEVGSLIDRLNDTYGEGSVASHSFDKGFYSKANKEKAGELSDQVIMPKRGKRNHAEEEEERESSFKKLRHAHSAVESNINSLEHHGLDRCPDKGLPNYKRYVGLGVLGYNLQIVGRQILQKNELARRKQAKAA